MEYNIELKNVPSVVVLTHLKKCTAAEMEKTAYELYSVAEAHGTESLFCVMDQPHLRDEVEVKVCCPISTVDVAYHEKKYKIEVLPRALVLSTIHHGEYNELKPAFEAMFRYIQKNNLTSAMDYRVIFHREKREWDRTSTHKKPETDYITEVQIQIFDK